MTEDNRTDAERQTVGNKAALPNALVTEFDFDNDSQSIEIPIIDALAKWISERKALTRCMHTDRRLLTFARNDLQLPITHGDFNRAVALFNLEGKIRFPGISDGDPLIRLPFSMHRYTDRQLSVGWFYGRRA